MPGLNTRFVAGLATLVLTSVWFASATAEPSQVAAARSVADSGHAIRAAELTPGWNLVGWTGPERPAAELASEIPGLQAIFEFDGSAQAFRGYRPAAAAASDLDTLRAGAGLWLLVDEPGSWSPPSVDEPRVVPLWRGFNLEAWTGPSGTSIGAALASLGCAVDAAFAWDAEAGAFVSYRTGIPAVLNSLTRLDYGDAIWLLTNRAAEWDQPARSSAPAVSPVTACEPAQVGGELRQWHPLTLTFTGPQRAEDDDPNPFLDYRLTVTFTSPSGRTIRVPGYFAADGNAAHSGAVEGSRWRAHLTPDEQGLWTYAVSFRTGAEVALSAAADAGSPTAFDGRGGTLAIGPSDKTAPDHRARGLLRYVGEHYLQFAGDGSYFLKGGADSPENFLAYADFDGTSDTKGDFLHRYEPHRDDWRPGDPTWGDGRGRAIIGALNYLSGKGVNSVYFITYNLNGGDGGDVWPWSGPRERFRFDVSKLAQWEIVFSHMDAVGIQLHFLLQETENDQGLDGGDLGPERRLYLRELIARFGHHLALAWNLGEENTNTDAQRREFAEYIRGLDAYDHPIVVHTFPGSYDSVYTPLLGFAAFEGPSLQTNDTHRQTLRWRERSAAAGRPWVVTLDEIGPFFDGVLPDSEDPTHDGVRRFHLWGNLMAGGAGVEWYFGYDHPHNDLNLEDFRSRDLLWDQTRIAREFFQRHLPFTTMRPLDDLTDATDDYVFANPGAIYAVYLPEVGDARITLSPGTYEVSWYNPRTGGELRPGTRATVSGGVDVAIGRPVADADGDWVALIRRG